MPAVQVKQLNLRTEAKKAFLTCYHPPYLRNLFLSCNEIFCLFFNLFSIDKAFISSMMALQTIQLHMHDMKHPMKNLFKSKR